MSENEFFFKYLHENFLWCLTHIPNSNVFVLFLCLFLCVVSRDWRLFQHALVLQAVEHNEAAITVHTLKEKPHSKL